MEITASLVFAAAVCFLIVRALRQRGLLQELAPVVADVAHPMPAVAVIIPARNEAANIGPCLLSLAGQTYPTARLRIFVVDDGSSDGTPEIVRGLAAKFPLIRLFHSPPLGDGWTGKCQACWEGATAVDQDTDYLCFIDADMRAQPDLLRSSIAAALEGDIALLSLAPRHELGSFAERLLLPCGHYLLGFRQDLAELQAPDSHNATVTGQFILVHRSAYEQVGGHAAVRGIISEDVALGRLVKNSGSRVLLMGGTQLISTRMYQGWHSLWHGIAKNYVDMLDGPLSTVTTGLAAFVLAWAAYLLPLLDGTACRAGSNPACAGLVFALPASASVFGLHLAGSRYFRIPVWYALLFPLAYTVGVGIAFDSVLRRFTGRVRWKDRIYP
ncbi:MAG TPA: glycosyltransferase family 2 protein [Micropepsaceae bacterium]|nr:glycosyltransferase family 2 protein [Micropepsaceae bacterium]